MQKILFITPRYPPTIIGGGEISLKLLAEKLSNIMEVTVLSMDGKTNEVINNVKIKRRRYFGGLFQSFLLFLYILKIHKNYNIIHGYNTFFYHYLGVLSLFIRTPIFVTLNSLASSYKNNEELILLSKVKNYFVNKIKYKISLSNALKEYYIDKKLDSKKIEVIPNMIDDNLFYDNQQVKRTKWDGNEIKLLYIGMLYKRKGVDILIKALKECLVKGMKASLTIVGAGPEYNCLIKLVYDLGLEKDVTFIGKVEYSCVSSYYRKADLLVHPARLCEPFGRTIIEAMWHNIPVLVSDVGAPPEIIGENELIFKSEDFIDLSEKLFRLYNNKELIDKLASVLKEKSREYHPKVVLPIIINFYNKGLKDFNLKELKVG